MKTVTFLDHCLLGTAVPTEIDTYVTQWHAGTLGQGMTLRELLGMTKDEYARWTRGALTIQAILAGRQASTAGSPDLPLRTFPSIEQYRHIVADVLHRAEYIGKDDDNRPVYDASRAKPVLTFKGTVKLHGSNCGVAVDLQKHVVYAQSKERQLSVEQDNFGFCAWTKTVEGAIDVAYLAGLALDTVTAESAVTAIRIFGEWCGPKVNGKTGIGQLSTRWVVFAVLATLADGQERWLPVEPIAAAWASEPVGRPSLVHFVTDYPQYTLDIDFNQPEASLDALEALTLAIEAECPVAKALGGGGIGEGLVWACQDPTFGRHVFKTKGAKHKGTKNSSLVQIAPEVLASLEAFTDAVLTDNRLEQGYSLIEADHGKVTEEHIGLFLKWVGQDVLKEETDTLVASGLERKQVMGCINSRAKKWLMPRLARV